MRLILLVVSAVFCAMLAVSGSAFDVRPVVSTANNAIAVGQSDLSPGTLCGRDETVVFNCPAKRSAKIISLCSTKEFDKTRGYLQYRFGTRDKTELKFPAEVTGSQKLFFYSHYFRARFDQTEISFNNGDYNYRIFDYYQGEVKPETHTQGLIVTPPGTKRSSTTIECASAAKADYGKLDEILPCDPDNNVGADCP